MGRLIDADAAIDALKVAYWDKNIQSAKDDPCIVDAMTDWAIRQIKALPSAQPEIIRCMECKHWRQQTNYQGALLSFGFCESDDMWRSLYGETCEVSHIETDDDFYCGYAERREDE